MRAGPLARLRLRTRPPLALGILVAALCVVAETLFAGLLKQITATHSLDVVYLLGIVLVASVWGVWLGMATAVVSTVALDYFFIPPIGGLSPEMVEGWATLSVFFTVALLAGWICGMSRSLGREVDARGEADLAASLARILLESGDLKAARPVAAQYLAGAFNLSSAAIQLGAIPGDERHVVLLLHGNGALPMGSLLVPAGLPLPTLRRLRERVVPSLEVLLRAARDRQRILDGEAALRRLATLVARGTPPAEVFDAVAREVGQLLDSQHAAVMRYGPNAPVATVGRWSRGRAATPSAGSGWLLEKGTVADLVARTKALGRIGVAEATAGAGKLPTSLRNIGINAAVGCPVTVGGRLWGALVAGSTSKPLPEDTGKRMLAFTDLLATAIANADSQAKLEASRTRVLVAGDATRRLIERDIHAGTQQRLVSLMLELRSTATTPPADPEELRGRLSEMTKSLGQAVEDMQEIARGLHPALLSRQGLEPAIKALARACTVPVELNVSVGRLPERYEITVYHVVAEALTNAAEHANASVVHVDVSVNDAIIRLRIRDDGKGGADPDRGSGLLNITDRVEALGGRLQITSRVGGGTSLLAEIPIANGRGL